MSNKPNIDLETCKQAQLFTHKRNQLDGGAVIRDPTRRIGLIYANTAWGFLSADTLMRCRCATHNRIMIGSMPHSAAISSAP